MSGAPLRILTICGSLRESSSNALILAAAARLAPPGVELLPFDGLSTLPHFNPDLDRRLDDPALPAAVRDMRALLGGSNALLISSPEYAHGVPGVLKNALDWLVGGAEMVDLPVALWNTAPYATHAQASLAETLRTMSATIVEAAGVSVSLGARGVNSLALAADPELAPLLQQALLALKRVAADRS